MFRIQLGDKVKDLVTGFTGIVTARSEFLNGCIRYGVQHDKVNKDGKPQDTEWFDEKQLIVTKELAVNVVQRRTGGPASTPRMGSDPR